MVSQGNPENPETEKLEKPGAGGSQDEEVQDDGPEPQRGGGGGDNDVGRGGEGASLPNDTKTVGPLKPAGSARSPEMRTRTKEPFAADPCPSLFP